MQIKLGTALRLSNVMLKQYVGGSLTRRPKDPFLSPGQGNWVSKKNVITVKPILQEKSL